LPSIRRYPNVGYDPRKDFAPVGLIATSPLIILVNQSVAAHNVQELIALAKTQPGELNYASAGPGSGIHLGTALFAETAGINITHVSYKGSGPALADLLGGHVQIFFSSLPPAVGLVKEGKLRALGVTGLKRSRSFPDVPTVAEQGLPGFEAVLHYGIVAPAGTPRPIIDKLNASLRAALSDPIVHDHIATEGAEPLPTSPDEYAVDIDREETKWSALVRKTGVNAK
jgi:tripartite-type tricarboxylate transporter receptor subunit TctC